MMMEALPLASAFRFTGEDLQANRQGKVTAAQRRRLWRRLFVVFFGGLLLLLVPILLAWSLITFATNQSFSEAFWDGRMFSGYLVGLLLWSIYLGANYRTWLLGLDLLRGKVISVAGPVRVWGRYLILEDYQFVIDETALSLVKTGLRYRVFILPSSCTLLSIEFSE
jgi:hypothetical protein